MSWLASWSARRVILACVLWLILAPVFAAIGLLLGALVLDVFSGTRRVGLSVRLNDWAGGWLFFPPVALVGAWLWSRGRRTGATIIKTE